MNQKKTGMFLKELRKEKQLTQEQLAEILGVTNRSVSRWENGVNMPDLDLIIEIANYYGVGIEEILDGERKSKIMDKKTEQTLLKVAGYENQDKIKLSKRMCVLFIAAIIAFIVYGVIEINGLASTGIYEIAASAALGIVFGVLLLGALYTSRYMAKIQAFKRRLIYKTRKLNQQTEDKSDDQER
ncbi:MAG: helix-turn-helix domain-containing protein [Butyrivibrio sp.]|nr:helix-turn-helix domain-containing protein [Butyrivibrio sp.]